ncbi:MAG: type IV pilus assembly protein PilM [Deltaproteobacteria bacterium]|nr:type IV pilus assembly protein PilM [Deltaproteobacteria bacterium]MBW2015524.1 type IV pilus assembly protein PilM [Deltaproteobacteria bacterium]MBW2128727.1 type IV pilus assembly protein PilM [Deltaproteobacteria bacterium]MBW2302195.1 type IV pilus assembly protein PilM [Deltaproteobacteria bacterium]
MPISKRNQLIGLDIGSHSIKLVEIDHTKKGMVLKNFGVIGLPEDAISEGTIKEMEIVASSIKTLYKNLKIKNKNVATSISGYSVIVKRISIPKREETELESTIQDEAEQYIPFDINDVNLDYDILSVSEESPEDKEEGEKGDLMDIMLVAAKKDIVDDYVGLLHLAGLNPAVLDVDAFSLQNAFEASYEDITGCYAIVNVGAEELGINAIKDGISLFTRDSSYGGFQINQAIMEKFDVTYEEAERIKLGEQREDLDLEALEEIFTSVTAEWVSEIKRALDFLSTTYPDESIEKIFLCGGSCRLPGFRKYLAIETEIPVEEFNPFVNLSIKEKNFDPKYLTYVAPQAAVAVGLALRSVGDK